MKFLLFNVAVIGALAYLFVVERDGLGLGGGQDEVQVEALRQQVESLAQEIAQERDSATEAARQELNSEARSEPAQEPSGPSNGCSRCSFAGLAT